MKKFIVAVAALAMMAGSAYAADWNFYGSARVSTFWAETDVINGASGDTVFTEGLQSNARIGAKVKASDELIGRFEYGTSGGNANIRLLYGEWNFGAGKLLVGQDYVPLYMPGSNQVYATDNGLGSWGEMYGGRKAQIKLTFGDFQIAFMDTDSTYGNNAEVSQTGTDTTIPQLQAQYKMAGDNWKLLFVAGYNTFDTVANNGVSVDSYALGVDGAMTFGAFTVKAQVHGGTNVGNLYGVDTAGAAAASTAGKGYAKVNGTTVVDNDSMGYRLVLAYKVNDMFGLEAGYGHMEMEYDEAGSTDDEVNAYYIQAPITLAPGVFVVPEFGVTDYEENNQNEVTYFGAKWQINF